METVLIWGSVMSDNLWGFLSMSRKSDKFAYALLELKYLSGKKDKSLFYQISDQPTSKNLLLLKHW